MLFAAPSEAQLSFGSGQLGSGLACLYFNAVSEGVTNNQALDTIE